MRNGYIRCILTNERTIYESNGIVNDIDTLPLGNLQNRFLPTGLRVVDNVIRTPKTLCDVEFALRACRCNHASAEGFEVRNKDE